MPLRLLDFFPIPFLIYLAMLTFLVIRSRWRGWKYQVNLVLFGTYLMAVLVIVFFPIPVPADWPQNLSRRGTLQALSEINLNLFRTAARLITLNASRALLRDLTMNFFLTIPFGFGLAYLKSLNFRQTLLYTLLVGLSLEGVQLLIKLGLGVFYHAIDVNDVMMNGLGFLTGALLYLGLRKMSSSAGRDRLLEERYRD
jgi:glycopeptide antibiotics resistance protein